MVKTFKVCNRDNSNKIINKSLVGKNSTKKTYYLNPKAKIACT